MSTGKSPPLAEMDRRRLSHEQYYKAVQFIKRNKELLINTRPHVKPFNDLLFKECGFRVSRSTLGKLKESANVRWHAATVPENVNGVRIHTGAAMQVLTNTLIALYGKLGETVPTQLFNLKAKLDQKSDLQLASDAEEE